MAYLISGRTAFITFSVVAHGFMMFGIDQIEAKKAREATAIQIAFPLRPRALRIEPPLKYEESTLPGGEYLVELSTLAPKEWIAVNALWEGFSFLPIYVRSAAGPAVEQPLQLQRVLPLWVRVLLWGLLLLGTWTAIYWALRVLALPYLRVWIR